MVSCQLEVEFLQFLCKPTIRPNLNLINLYSRVSPLQNLISLTQRILEPAHQIGNNYGCTATHSCFAMDQHIRL